MQKEEDSAFAGKGSPFKGAHLYVKWRVSAVSDLSCARNKGRGVKVGDARKGTSKVPASS